MFIKRILALSVLVGTLSAFGSAKDKITLLLQNPSIRHLNMLRRSGYLSVFMVDENNKVYVMVNGRRVQTKLNHQLLSQNPYEMPKPSHKLICKRPHQSKPHKHSKSQR